ncbi:MAG: GGDEF domain-containing protein [Phycisphaeraceae bacterium]|nr:GGDEF domain-containing protein [Phycisphaeraceae bacterium]
MSEAIRHHDTAADAARWLVIDDPATTRLAAGVAGVRIASTPNYLTALAELVNTPVEVVIGPVSKLTGMAQTTAAALRELAPQAQLIVTAPQDQQDEARAAVEAGFDGLMILPNAEQAPQSNSTASTAATSAKLETRNSKLETPHDDQLGDVDLVEAVLEGRNQLPSLALRIVISQSAIAGLDLATPGKAAPEGHASVEVACHGHSFGRLHAPAHATATQLQPWADWLARWLALHRRQLQLHELAMRDELTGAWNRRYFNRFLRRILDRAGHDRSQVTVMVFDIDNFKHYNDNYGHWAGDEILRESARLMKTVCREHDVVARIGGDEFAVIFWDAEAPRRPNSHHPQDVVRAAERFQAAICSHAFPKLLDQAPDTLTISGGLASYPWDGRTPDELLHRADEMTLESKRNGKNAITYGPGAARLCRQPGS